ADEQLGGLMDRIKAKGDQAFAQWQAQRAQPAADVAATATSEAQANVPTPSDAAPEPVSPTVATSTASASPEAAKPARADDP
ncbi:hypothetical protein PSYMO_34392, partial [Pseudomonas amygdali pv. mori str. 301020]